MARNSKKRAPAKSKEPSKDEPVKWRSHSIGNWISSLYSPTKGPDLPCPFWPPDLFAVTGSLLRRTGAYRHVFETPENAAPGEKGYSSRLTLWRLARELGTKWRGNINRSLQNENDALSECIPDEIKEWWNTLLSHGHVSLSNFCDSFEQSKKRPSTASEQLKTRNPVEAALCLTVAADQACASIGLKRFDPKNDKDRFLQLAQEILESSENNFRSQCLQISRELIAVLPKHHTPQTGLTFRSLSHHVALCPAGEIRTRWFGPFVPRAWEDHLNILLLPWPTDVSAKDFRLVPMAKHDDVSHYRVFEYRPNDSKSPALFSSWFSRAIKKAKDLSESVHAVVLPEAALNADEYAIAERIAVKQRVMLIAGVRLSAEDSNLRAPSNACVIQTGGLFGLTKSSWRALSATRIVQAKHHRWRIDRNQVLQYELGAQLPATGQIWENIVLPERSLQFVSLSSWMTWCALICEDLARQEPAAEVVRAIGPNLVIALLMDGPQLKERWASRYASGLADDPGSSVLAFTNLGMAKRSKPLEAGTKQRDDHVVALWRDVLGGSKELALQPSHDACILSLVCHSAIEYSADGCKDPRLGHYPIYAGHVSFKVS